MQKNTWQEVEYAPPTPEEIELSHGIPTDLSEYEAVDGTSGWERHRTMAHWLYHAQSEVLYNSEAAEYYRIENGQPVPVNEGQNDTQKEPEPKELRKRGTVKYFVEAKDYGFILQEDGLPDLYLRRGAQGPEYRAGQTVEYTIGTIDSRTAAVDVVVTQDVFEAVPATQAEEAEILEESKPEKRMDREGVYQAMGAPAEWDRLLRAGDATLRGRQLHNEDR